MAQHPRCHRVQAPVWDETELLPWAQYRTLSKDFPLEREIFNFGVNLCSNLDGNSDQKVSQMTREENYFRIIVFWPLGCNKYPLRQCRWLCRNILSDYKTIITLYDINWSIYEIPLKGSYNAIGLLLTSYFYCSSVHSKWGLYRRILKLHRRVDMIQLVSICGSFLFLPPNVSVSDHLIIS